MRNDPFRRSRQWFGLPLYRAAGFVLLSRRLNANRTASVITARLAIRLIALRRASQRLTRLAV
ncbi:MULTISPECIES: hypothetical protein [unclassified Burkholderia]|uniref:hypothetical protein n=1 Tax=unclassified Burkholderia TaxID=2613784 RepID=UPI00141EAE54|nr:MULTISPECIES: hypothetical protein [unclassified Burkholderia]NIE62109.1 hypothetical protein [Burkholderia sp. Ap-955]NIF14948.1 hypothetical protein [Burkholderia sp. Ax-1735]NIG07990.1 hypothetical protein [Burkholderia sp. Tr-849]